MATKCLCDKHHSIRFSGSANIRAKNAVLSADKQKFTGIADIRGVQKTHSLSAICRGSGKLSGFVIGAKNVEQRLKGSSNIRVKGTFPLSNIKARVGSSSKLNVGFVQKFAGNFKSLKALSGFIPQQKLYPSGDITNSIFHNQLIEPSNLYQSIDEGVYTGDFLKGSTIVSDDGSSYIQPSSVNLENSIPFKCAVDPAIVHTRESFLFFRAAGPLQNKAAGTAPMYKISNIKLEDPSGNLIVKYKDISFRGDCVYDSTSTLSKNYSTYITEPEINKGAYYQWQDGFPFFGSDHVRGGNSFTLSMNLESICVDDPFDIGFNKGYEEESCGVPEAEFTHGNFDHFALRGNPMSTQTQGLFSPLKSIRISAIEISNSGHPRDSSLALGPVSENYLNINSKVSPFGEQIVRHIFPKRVMPWNFKTTIFPDDLRQVWESVGVNGIETSNFTQNVESGLALGKSISDRSVASYIRSTNVYNNAGVEIDGSGKLITAFADTEQTFTSKLIPGAYQSNNYRFGFDQPRFKQIPISDSFYANIRDIKLVFKARMLSSTQDTFSLDVVGYSDDGILMRTSPIGGFLQNVEGGTVAFPEVVSSSISLPNASMSSDSLSANDQSVTLQTNVPNSGGDHYILGPSPVVSGSLFKEYTLPLKIYDFVPEGLGSSKSFNSSPYFENIILDMYNVPSGAEFSDMRLEVTYSPQNALHMHTLGSPTLSEIYTSNNRLKVEKYPHGGLYMTHIPPVAINTDGDILIPEGYAKNTLRKTSTNAIYQNVVQNHAKRWRGVTGNNFYRPFEMSFSSSFSDGSTSHPFPLGYFDFTKYNSDSVLDSLGRNISGVFQGVTNNDIYKQLGWRFNSTSIFTETVNSYNGDPLPNRTIAFNRDGDAYPFAYGTLTDKFDTAVRVSGVDKHISIESPSGDSWSFFMRFSPDFIPSGLEGITGSRNIVEGPAVLASKYNSGNDLEFALVFHNYYLKAYSTDNLGNLVTISDTYPNTMMEYPMSILLTYDADSQTMSLYRDNDSTTMEQVANNNRLAGQATFQKKTTDQPITIGYSSGSGIGASIFVTEFGVSDRAIPSGAIAYQETVITNGVATVHNKSLGSADQLFDSYKQYNYQSPHNKLYSYIDNSIGDKWNLGEFKECQFNDEFSRLNRRSDDDYIEHRLVHDGLPYSSRTNLPFPSTLNASGLAYHTQIENDFIRFNIQDAQTIAESGKLYAAAPRIIKKLPRGYKFSEKAVSVETILHYESDANVVWPDGKLGPKFIVSLYSPSLIPEHGNTDPAFGLINRESHYLEPSGCIHKAISKFNRHTLLDESEPWSVFNRDHIVREFDHKYYVDEINDMFLQYDVVYPSGSAFESTIKVYSAEILLEDALMTAPTYADKLIMSVSGELVWRDELSLAVGSCHQEFAVNVPSGLLLATGDNAPSGLDNLPSGLFLVGSGDQYWFNELNLIHGGGHLSFGGRNDQFGSDPQEPELFLYASGQPRADGSLPLSLFNNEVVPSTFGSLLLRSHSNFTVEYGLQETFNLFTDAPSIETANILANQSLNLMVYKKDIFGLNSPALNLTLDASPEVFTAVDAMTLFTTNYAFYDSSLSAQETIHWNGENKGTNILVTDDAFVSLPADDEIRGVVTTCYGDCSYNGTCNNPNVITHGIDWSEIDCVDGGILRGFRLYTNASANYQDQYFGVRKYTGLLPSYPYTITMRGYSGSTTPVELPRRIENVEYGSNPEVNYSGIKLFTNDPYGLNAKYGKSISIAGDLMAVGAPEFDLYEGAKHLDKSGAVFLYRRLAAPSGTDWTSQDDKSGWNLEEVLTLPSGFQRDYYSIKMETIQGVEAPVRQWGIGNYGRNFGYSVSVGKDPSTSKEVVAVGAPRGKFDRTFDEVVPTKKKACVMIVTDEFAHTSDTTRNNYLLSTIDNRNNYFTLYSNPAFNIELDIIILEPNANNPDQTFTLFEQDSRYPYIHRFDINRMYRNDGQSQSDTIKQQIISAFDSVYPRTAGMPNSGLPCIIDLIVDDSASCGRTLVEPAIDDFANYYKAYTHNSGVVDFRGDAASGVFNEITYVRQANENWLTYANAAVDDILSDVVVSGNKEIFTSGYGLMYAESDYRFNKLPPSGGRVYVFENETAKSGLFYNEDTSIWSITQEIGNDLRLNNSRDDAPNDRFGHSVAISKDLGTLVVGSPYDDDYGVRVYGLRAFDEPIDFYRNIITWLSSEINDNVRNGFPNTTYNDMYDFYLEKKSSGMNDFGALKTLYETLTPSGRYDLRSFISTNLPKVKTRYQKSFQYHNSYNFTGSRGDTISPFIPMPRVGYSVDVNDDGTILAVGCPTDSMAISDNLNLWSINRRICDEHKNAMGNSSTGGYQSPFSEEADLQTVGAISTTHEGTWSSYTNAGAVQVFNGRRYYPHNKVVEYGIFGNMHEFVNDPSSVEAGTRKSEFNIVSGVYSNLNNVTFEKTAFDDPEIPQEAAMLFIITPQIDSLSDEVLENITEWMSYGDRNLVIVGDDPVYESNGAYRNSNELSNLILDKMGSRVRILPAKTKSYATADPYTHVGDGATFNVVPASRPKYSIAPIGNYPKLFASGVADIRLWDETIEFYHHSCDRGQHAEDLQQASTMLNSDQLSNILKYTYDTANIGCSQPIQHRGDLRTEWLTWCADIKGNQIKVPRSIPVAYGAAPGITDPLCNKGIGCDKPKDCDWQATNTEKAPVPLLAMAEQPADRSYTIPAVPETTVKVLDRIETVEDPTKVTTKFDEGQAKEYTAFNIEAVPSGTMNDGVENSGNFTSFNLNEGNNAHPESAFFKPRDLDKAYIAQSRNVGTETTNSTRTKAEDFAYLAAEERVTGTENSHVILLANVTSQSKKILLESDNDNAILFYRNILTKSGQEFDSDTISGLSLETINIAQLGGWTKRESFADGYRDTYLMGRDGTSGLLVNNRNFDHIRHLDQNVTVDELLNGKAGNFGDYDVCWIANTKFSPSAQDLEKINEWLQKDNKKLIITYAHDEDIADYSDSNLDELFTPSQIVADATSSLCEGLGLGMKPLYLPGAGRYAEFFKDNFNIDMPFRCRTDTLDKPMNPNHYACFIRNGSKLSEITTVDGLSDTPKLPDRTVDRKDLVETLFIPIELNGATYIYYGKPTDYHRFENCNLRVADYSSVNVQQHYNNSGFIKVTFPTPNYQASGYIVKAGFYSESPNERGVGKAAIYIPNSRYNPDPDAEATGLSVNAYDVERNPVSFLDGNGISFIGGSTTGSFREFELDPIKAESSETDVYVSMIDMRVETLSNGEAIPFTSRLAYIKAYPVPITQEIGVKLIYHYRDEVVPAIPERTVVNTPPLRELQGPHFQYCPDQGCLEDFSVPLNDRGGPTQGSWEARYLAGDNITTVDGPVVVTQEVELLSSFSAGVARSRITVISDASLIQGSNTVDPVTSGIRPNLQNFLASLYPTTNFPDANSNGGIQYTVRNKIVAPERSSPYKLYSVSGVVDGSSKLISRFNPNANALSIQSLSTFTGKENRYDPKYIFDSKYFWQCEDFEAAEFDEEAAKKAIRQAFASSLAGGISSMFSGVVDGKAYGDNNQLFKDTNYDWLDFEVYDEGYPGDLFGYSVALNGDKLFVGAPFTAYDQEDKVVKWEEISSTPNGQFPSGVELSSNGGAGAVYMYENTGQGKSEIRDQISDWEYIRKFRPETINVGQDYVSGIQAVGPSKFGSTVPYSDIYIEKYSQVPDKFGFSVSSDNGILAIGAPGHDFELFAVTTSGDFMNKEFGNSFIIPRRTVHDFGSSGVRSQYPDSGIAILNNGAVYIYSEDYSFEKSAYEWTQLEKVVAQGINSQAQYFESDSDQTITYGAENSNFGAAVSVERRDRSDSDYVIGVGSKNHPFDDTNIEPCYYNQSTGTFSTSSADPNQVMVECPSTGAVKKQYIQALHNGWFLGTYTNDTGHLIIYDGVQTGTFNVGDLIKFRFSSSSVVNPDSTYEVKAVVSHSEFDSRTVYSPSQVLVVGCPSPALQAYSENRGAAYTYDLMLRRQPPAVHSEQTDMYARLFAHPSGTVIEDPEIKINIVNGNDDNKLYEIESIIRTNKQGEIFLEISGSDPSVFGFIQHRPYIESVYGRVLSGTGHTNAMRLSVEGRPDEASGVLNLSTITVGVTDVYNSIVLNTFNDDNVIFESGLKLFASGIGIPTEQLNLKTIGYE